MPLVYSSLVTILDNFRLDLVHHAFKIDHFFLIISLIIFLLFTQLAKTIYDYIKRITRSQCMNVFVASPVPLVFSVSFYVFLFLGHWTVQPRSMP